jgi:hypothetical protein
MDNGSITLDLEEVDFEDRKWLQLAQDNVQCGFWYYSANPTSSASRELC